MSNILSDAQIAGAAKAAGFSGSAVATITAIALAESGGDAQSHNPVPPDDSYGLTQINMLGSMGPERRQEFGLKSNTDLYDPVVNMKAAYAISNGGKTFRPWSTYTSGSYIRFVVRANKAAGNPSTSVPSANAQQVGLLDAGGAISSFFDFISNSTTWLRLGMIVAGALLIFIALSQVSGMSDKAKQLANAAVDVVPGGKAVKAAVQ